MLRKVFVNVAQKNGKTSFAAALALTKLLMEEEQREQIACLVANRLQSRIAFDAMTAMINAEGLGRRFDIVEYRHFIKCGPNNSQPSSSSGWASGGDGANFIELAKQEMPEKAGAVYDREHV